MNVLRALRGLLAKPTLTATRPQGAIAVGPRTLIAIAATGTGRLKAANVAFFVDGSFDGLVTVDVANNVNVVVVEFRGQQVLVPLKTLTPPTTPKTPMLPTPKTPTAPSVPRFAIPLPPSATSASALENE